MQNRDNKIKVIIRNLKMVRKKFKEAEQLIDNNQIATQSVQATPEEVSQATEQTPSAPVEPAVVEETTVEEVPTEEAPVEETPVEDEDNVSIEIKVPKEQLASAVAQATGDVVPAEASEEAINARNEEATEAGVEDDYLVDEQNPVSTSEEEGVPVENTNSPSAPNTMVESLKESEETEDDIEDDLEEEDTEEDTEDDDFEEEDTEDDTQENPHLNKSLLSDEDDDSFSDHDFEQEFEDISDEDVDYFISQLNSFSKEKDLSPTEVVDSLETASEVIDKSADLLNKSISNKTDFKDDIKDMKKDGELDFSKIPSGYEDEEDEEDEGYEEDEDFEEDEDSEKVKESKLSNRNPNKHLKEAKIYYDLLEDDSYEPWSGAIDRWEEIVDKGLVEELNSYLEDLYPDGMSETELNDFIWHEGDKFISQYSSSDEDEEEDEDYGEDDDDYVDEDDEYEDDEYEDEEDSYDEPYTESKKYLRESEEEEDDYFTIDMPEGMSIDGEDVYYMGEYVGYMVEPNAIFVATSHCKECEDYFLERDWIVKEAYKFRERTVSRVRCKFPRKQEAKSRYSDDDFYPEEDIDTSVIKFPEGSSPNPSDYELSSRELYRAHEKNTLERKNKLRNLREHMINSRRVPNRRFDEALKGSISQRDRFNEKGDATSWSSNRFIDKYEESQKLNFNTLLNDGYLG